MATAKFIGVYSCNSWPTKSPSGRKSNWFVWEDDWGRYRVQLLDGAFQPLDGPRIITTAEFKRHFTYQPKILVTPLKQLEVGTPEDEAARHAEELEKARRVKQDIAELSSQLGIEVTENTPEESAFQKRADTVVAGDILNELQSLDKQGGTAFPARQVPSKPAFDLKNYERAAQLDNETRTDFALAITRWRRGDKDRSMVAFKSILKLNEDIMPPHKHMFTDFAIDLRKCALTTLAKEFYRRAVALAPDDCNALFNLARIYFETGEIHSAVDTLDKALVLEPDFDYALRFRRFLYDNHAKQLRLNADGTPRKNGPMQSKDFRLGI